MKLFLLFAGLEAVIGAVLEARQQTICYHDNCYRDLTQHTASVAHDCGTFLSSSTTLTGSTVVTETPLPTTIITITTISTVYSIIGSGVVVNKRSEPTDFIKREAIPGPVTLAARAAPTPTIPAYASHCSSSFGFASACSCLGFTKAVTTITEPPVVTSTYVAYHEVYTATTTVAVCDPKKNYGLNYQGGYFPDPGPMNPGPYAYPNNGYGNVFYLNPSTTTFQSMCYLCFQTQGCTGYGFVNYSAPQPPLYFYTTFFGQTYSPTQYCPGGRETLLYDARLPSNLEGIGPCSDAYLCVGNMNCYSQPVKRHEFLEW